MSLKDDSQGPIEAVEVGASLYSWTPPRFMHLEAAVCEKLAVQRRQLAALRKTGALKKGVDWDFVQGQVAYVESGVEKLARHLSGAAPLAVVVALKKDRAALVDARVTGFMVNPVMVWAETVEKVRLKVRVRLARKFTVGMVIAVRCVEPDLAVYEGAEPRWAKDPQFWRQFPEPARAGEGVK